MRKISFGQRLVQIRKHFHINLTVFADTLNTVKSNVSRYERNLNKPTIGFLESLVKTYRINLNWLFGEEDNMLLPDKGGVLLKRKSKSQLDLLDDSERKVIEMVSINYTKSGIPVFKESIASSIQENLLPIEGSISAGDPMEITQTGYDFVPLPIYKSHRDLEDYIVFKVNGLSMSPEIQHEDIVFINKNNNWVELNNKIVAVRIQGETTLKRLSINNIDKEIVFKAINKRYKDIIIGYELMDSTQLIGELKAIRRIYPKKQR